MIISRFLSWCCFSYKISSMNPTAMKYTFHMLLIIFFATPNLICTCFRPNSLHSWNDAYSMLSNILIKVWFTIIYLISYVKLWIDKRAFSLKMICFNWRFNVEFIYEWLKWCFFLSNMPWFSCADQLNSDQPDMIYYII